MSPDLGGLDKRRAGYETEELLVSRWARDVRCITRRAFAGSLRAVVLRGIRW
jgi:hypothetical protein